MHTINERNRSWVWGLIFAAIFCMGAVLALTSCAGAPKDTQQFEQMDEADFQDWLTRVTVWSQLAADQVVRRDPDSAPKVVAFCDLVTTLGSDPDPLGAAASQAGLGSPIVAVLVLEAKALLNARGALPGGRTQEFLRAVAAGARLGAQPYLPHPTGF